MGGDQDVGFAGFIRRVKASSLTDVTEMSGALGVQSSEDVPSELVTFSEEFRSRHWRWRERELVVEGFVGRKTGRRSWRGERIVCIKYAISSRLSLPLNWTQTKISSVGYQMVEKSLPIWKLIMALHNTSPPAQQSVQLVLHILRNLTWMEYEQRRCRREKKKTITKKELISAPNHLCLATCLWLPQSPSSHSVHAFSREFAFADGVAGASGGIGAHMAVDAFGSPWTFFSYQTRTRSHQQIFPFHTCMIQYERTNATAGGGKNRQWQEKNRGTHPS